MDKTVFKQLPNPLYLVTWKAGYPEQYLGRVYDNELVALKVCEPDQVVVELRLAESTKSDYRRFARMNAPKPIYDNLPEKLTAHAIRRLRPCVLCNGFGDRDEMIVPSLGSEERFHTQCYIEACGFDAALRLPTSERGKFRLCDVTWQQARQLSNTP